MVAAADRRLTPLRTRPTRSSHRFGAALASVLLTAVLAGCTDAAGIEPASAPPAASGSSAAAEGSAQPARTGKFGANVRLRFVPQRVTLPDGSHAEVEPAATVDGVLAVPTDVRKVGWWDGSAEAGDPFGSTVIAGHVDSKTQGLGYFAKLRAIGKGATITVAGTPDRSDRTGTLRYRITAKKWVEKDALSADSTAFGQTGDHRLVLITCGGAYLPARGGYQENLVIIAAPV